MRNRYYDVIVVGSRCAGSTTALLLARRGLRVLLLDRAHFPSDTLSTHTLQLSGLAYLERWGLLERVRASGCPPFRRVSLDFGSFMLAGSPPPAETISETLCCRRIVLDLILLEEAIRAGVEWLEGATVLELLQEHDQIVGIRGRTATGGQISERARLIIGADGMNSRIARLVGSAMYHAIPSLTFSYYSYWQGISLSHAELFVRDGCAMAMVPTNDNLVIVVVQRRLHEFTCFRENIEKNFMLSLQAIPRVADMVLSGERVERFRGTAYQPNFLRQPWGKGWILVGDASCHKDSVTAQGISDAFHDAASVAEAVWRGLTGEESLEESLRQHQRRRDKRIMPIYRRAVAMAQLQVPQGPIAQFLRSLQDDQAQMDRFFGLDAGTVDIDTFFPAFDTSENSFGSP